MKQFVIILGTITLLIFCIQCNSRKIKIPQRPNNVPDSSKWIGGLDGGNWYFIKKILSNNIFEISIYNDKNGELEIDKPFILNADCKLTGIDSLTLLKSINGYDGKKILLLFPENGERCFLRQQ